MKQVFAGLLIVFGTLPIGSYAQPVGNENPALALYQAAKKLFWNPNPTPRTDSLAVGKFLSAAVQLRPKRENALILLDCYEKAGILRQTDGSQPEAIACYQKAIGIGIRYQLSDSLLFKPYLYCGNAHYFLHSFDSSIHYFERAEKILLRFPAVQEAERLYNSFGAIYYEAGNYRRSINYFLKALQIHQRRDAPDPSSLYSFRSNIASALLRLERYDSAARMYRSLIPLNIDGDEVRTKLGATYLEKNEPDSALHYLLGVKNVPEGSRSVDLENALGRAYFQKGNPGAAIRHLNKSLEIHRKGKADQRMNRKNNHVGLTYQLLAGVEQENGNLRKALQHYQQSIIQLDYDFNDPSVFRNPADFTEGFSSFRLFESLSAKAGCLHRLYEQEPALRYLKAAVGTYQSAFRLAEYIQKSFDSEEARLFIVEKTFPVYQEAVALMIALFERTKEPTYLKEAFRWSEQSKAAVLSISLKENEIKAYTGIPDSLLRRERNLKFNLSRLFLKADNADDAEATALESEIRDIELTLSRLTDQLHSYPAYYRKKFGSDSIRVSYLQEQVLDSRTALVSYFQSRREVYSFVVTRERIRHYKTAKDRPYDQALAAIGTELRTTVPGQPYRGSPPARLLYDKLIKPAERELAGISSLIIIPHNELNRLPFEVLEDPDHAYLLEKFDVTYRYAASFLRDENRGEINLQKMLALAPFGSANRNEREAGFARLPASREEIADLGGVKLVNAAATKEAFIRLAGEASVIHLATHAVADNEHPSRSYIAFYPAESAEYKLYAHELRNVSLRNTQLIFLSSCETASGKLIAGEGVLSLSRAFSYAGCSNFVTSLWKAEDQATTYVSVRFYAYLRKGYRFSKALQQAKIDLLHNGQYAQFHSPQYWSHLVFIGAPGRPDHSRSGWGLAGLAVTVLTSAFWWGRRRRRGGGVRGVASGLNGLGTRR
ncbi:MAG: CHAT domain-containing protein [Ferruginibacter sp.]|nr:CHAT domain-containing protein [Cytophagales bacterium]